MLPGTSLTTGQWVRVADPDDPVDCNSNSDSDPFLCTDVTSPNASINFYLAQGLPAAQEGWYKCCLPTNCSDPNTNIIFANIFSKLLCLGVSSTGMIPDFDQMYRASQWMPSSKKVVEL